MDCNREEAVRAKAIAEKKMEGKDFAGAHKFGVKAQQLYPGLDNLSQLLMVCQVHCSAQRLVGGNEKDWYGILKTDQKADELTIKKQYKKFALQLHPDKNKFPGAEAAFHLISEAQNVLLDRDKRSLHDIKCRTAVGKTQVNHRAPQRANHFQNVRTNVAARPNLQPQQQQQLPTFWTLCPFCHTKYQYYRVSALHKPLTCQSCKKLFVAYETITQAPPTSVNQHPYAQPKPGFSKVEVKRPENRTAEKPNSEPLKKDGLPVDGSSGKGSKKVNRKRDRKGGRKRVVASESSDSETSSNSEEAVAVGVGYENVNRKKGRKEVRKHVAVSESSDSETSSDSEETVAVDMEGVHPSFYGEQPRRSSRSKQQVVYNENLSDDDDVPLPEKNGHTSGADTREYKSSDTRESMKEDIAATQEGDPNITNLEEDKANEDHADKETSIEVPEPVYYNFDADKLLEKFEIGQIWALYSDEDGLPKYYGQIKSIVSRSSKLKIIISWLEPCSLVGIAPKWLDEGLPIPCGRFEIKRRRGQDYDSTMCFSHQVKAVPVSRNEVEILPQKGEVWALYKNWSPNFSLSELGFCEYDIVEVCEANGLERKVLVLGCTEGFNSIFKVKLKGGLPETMTIPETELLRFSHMIPSFRLTEEEGGSLRGCWELDPAAFPIRYYSKNWFDLFD